MSRRKAKRELELLAETIEKAAEAIKDRDRPLSAEEISYLSRFRGLTYDYLQRLLYNLWYAETRRALRMQDDDD